MKGRDVLRRTRRKWREPKIEMADASSSSRYKQHVHHHVLLPLRTPTAHLQFPPPRPHSRRRPQRLRHLVSPLQATQNRPHPIRTSIPLLSLSALANITQGFFSSLFTAGFLESSSSPGLQHVDIVFDDRNITRPGTSSPHLSHHLIHHLSIAFEYVPLLLSSTEAHSLGYASHASTAVDLPSMSLRH